MSTSHSRRRGEQEQHRQQDGQVQARRRLDPKLPGAEDEIAAQPVERDQQQERDGGEAWTGTRARPPGRAA